MKAVAYTIDGSAVPVQALRDAGEAIAVRNIRFFDGVEGFDAVALEVEDERIREAYESAGATVTVIPAAEAPVVPHMAPTAESDAKAKAQALVDSLPGDTEDGQEAKRALTEFLDQPTKVLHIENAMPAETEAPVTKAPEVVKAAPAKKSTKRN